MPAPCAPTPPYLRRLCSDWLQRQVLEALAQHTEPDRAALQLVRLTFPSAVMADEEGGTATFKSLPAADRDLLSAALVAAAAALVAQATQAQVQVMAYRLEGNEQPAAAALVDATLWLCDQQPAPVDAGLPAQLLEQVVESVPTEECEGVFAYLDSRIAAFKQEAVFNRSNLTLLRTCNLLLKRLSKVRGVGLPGPRLGSRCI